ncbi:putative Histone-lysine N-methyltransferase NSD2 [Daphnia magna]|uniref:Putative Histone-lysine N-methyltransferase NSD2 n=1 Tax=Daphnia magna TaxID=35525 RepID=A0A164TK38_9CRUS|nr:putative Histone-lysine N-methyltransferase NSD2 [Daphnia magna]
MNRTMAQALAAYVNTDHDDWDCHLPAAVFAINTARQTLENQFPWPKERPKPFEIFLSVSESSEKLHVSTLSKKQEKSKRLVDLRRRVVRDLRPGELVLVRRKLKKKTKTKKFLLKYVGPFQVVKKICPTTYLVENLPAKRHKKRFRRFNDHVVQIRKFQTREDVELDDWLDEPDENAI